jgi:heterodisulfide reductase subunit C
MGNKVYFMIKTAEEAGKEGYEEALKGLEAIPEVESIESVSGDYDLVARVDVPKRVVPIANKILENGGIKRIEILRVEPLEPNPFMEEVCSSPGGEGVLWCAQCGLCSASCPNVAQMDYSPRKIIALIRAGKRNEVLSSNSMGVCLSCYLCTVRCPREVKITELMHTLEGLAVRHKLSSPKTSTPTMHRFFVNSIKRNGRVHELGLMLRFYLKTNPFAAIKMLPIALKLLLHGRLPLRAKKIKGTEQIKAILDETQVMGGAL